MLGTVGPWQLIIILVIIVILFGGKRLPEIGAGIGKAIRNFKDATSKVDEDEKKLIDDDHTDDAKK
jgi:sec-independent protein translocase protein TatA